MSEKKIRELVEKGKIIFPSYEAPVIVQEPEAFSARDCAETSRLYITISGGELDKSGELARAVALGARVVDIRRLHDALVQKIDASNSSFWAARNVSGKEGPSLGLMERQRLKLWLNHAFGEIETAGV